MTADGSNRHRVAVTGLGVKAPAGTELVAVWKALL